MRSHWSRVGPPNPVWVVSLQDDLDTDAYRGRWCEHTRWKTGQRQRLERSPHTLGPQGLWRTSGRGKKGFSSERQRALPTPCLQPSSLWNWERVSCCCPSPPIVGMLVQQPWETNYTNHIKSTFPKEHCESTALLWSQQSLGSNTRQIKAEWPWTSLSLLLYL